MHRARYPPKTLATHGLQSVGVRAVRGRLPPFGIVSGCCPVHHEPGGEMLKAWLLLDTLLSHHRKAEKSQVEPSRIEDRLYFQDPGRSDEAGSKKTQRERSVGDLPCSPPRVGRALRGRGKGSGPRNWFYPFFSPSAPFLGSRQGVMNGQFFVCLFLSCYFIPFPPLLRQQNHRNNLLLVILDSIR